MKINKDLSDDYTFYKYCKGCGEVIDEDVYDDNEGFCDYCYTKSGTWKEVPFGINSY